jgi:hypothetical protein
MFLPERYVTEFSNTFNCFIPAASATAAAGNYSDIVVNSLAAQFNATYPMTLTPGATYAFHGTAVQGNSIAQTPLGFTNFVGMYTKFKVMRFKVILTVQPAASSDTAVVVLSPLGAEEIPSTGAGSVNTHVMESQPNAVSKVVSWAVAPRENTLVIEHYPWDILGVRKDQYCDQSPDPIGLFPATPIYAGIFLQELNGTSNGSAIVVQCTIQQVVELCDLVQPIN